SGRPRGNRGGVRECNSTVSGSGRSSADVVNLEGTLGGLRIEIRSELRHGLLFVCRSRSWRGNRSRECYRLIGKPQGPRTGRRSCRGCSTPPEEETQQLPRENSGPAARQYARGS